MAINWVGNRAPGHGLAGDFTSFDVDVDPLGLPPTPAVEWE